MLITVRGPRAFKLFFLNPPKILLDGAEIRHIVEADDEAGYIIRLCTDEASDFVVEGPKYRERVKTERLEGVVSFIGTRRYSPDDAKAAAASKRDRRAARNLRIQNRAEVREFDADAEARPE